MASSCAAPRGQRGRVSPPPTPVEFGLAAEALEDSSAGPNYGLPSDTPPQRLRVPPAVPDTVPAWVYAPANLASDTGASYDYYADVIIVGFKATATQADRQAAIDSINGTVVGGQPMPPGEGFYFVRLEAARRLEPLTRAVTKLWSLPQVASASLVTPLEEQFRRPR
ncbi:MAG: hypothetical protein DMD33_10345 [Gemmatimonadetes bacterium]|nr:MAG: hypothetical protein DMD33_10345 [Gemmatimonadota bacterium]PYO78955.1 MAG: hypothetical protein DMD67_03950 [Gemmatimonadota bacterium]